MTRTATRDLELLFREGAVAGLSDGELLERFLIRGDSSEAAFRALVARHGPMVWGLCRRMLADPNDAEDAFQATFLVLVKKAQSVRVEDSLGRWLYGVGFKVAARARRHAAKRGRSAFLDGEIPDLAPPVEDGETAGVLDEELSHLPERFRAVIVLCDLNGLSQEDAARQLRCPVGTIKSRLSRGREQLRSRLLRRGLGPGLLPPVLLAPRVPTLLQRATADLVSRCSRGLSPTVATSATVHTLTEGVLQTMLVSRWKLVGLLFLAAGTLGVVSSTRRFAPMAHAEGAKTSIAVKQVADPPTGIQTDVDRSENTEGFEKLFENGDLSELDEEIISMWVRILGEEVECLAKLLADANFGVPTKLGETSSEQQKLITAQVEDAKVSMKKAMNEMMKTSAALTRAQRKKAEREANANASKQQGPERPDLDARVKAIEQKLDLLLKKNEETKADRT